MIEVVLICSGGYLLASKGILDKTSQRSLSLSNLYLFTPCLIFAKLGAQLRWQVIKNLWVLPVLVFILICIIHSFKVMLITPGVGYTMARIASRIGRLDSQWTKFVVACTIFQNVYLRFLLLLTVDQRAAYCDHHVVSTDSVFLTFLSFN